MTTDPKLPAWTGDLDRHCNLAAGHYRAKVVRQTGTGGRRSVRVEQRDEAGRVVKVLLCSISHPCVFIDSDTGRAVCEQIIRQALRADEAEAKIHDLRHERNERQAAWAVAVARADKAEAKVRQLAVQVHNLLPIEDVVEELAAEVPAEEWAKLDVAPRGIDVVLAQLVLASYPDWDRIRLIAREIPDNDWAKLLEARDEEESG